MQWRWFPHRVSVVRDLFNTQSFCGNCLGFKTRPSFFGDRKKNIFVVSVLQTQQENCVLNWHFWVDEIQQLVEFYKFSSSNAATLITLDTFQCLWGPSQFPSWHSGQMWKFRVAGPVATCTYSKVSIKRPVLLNDLVWIFPISLY